MIQTFIVNTKKNDPDTDWKLKILGNHLSFP